jgi:hypothetical protein
MQFNTNLIQKFSETKLQDFYSYLPTDKFPQLRSLGLQMIAILGSTYVWKQFFLFIEEKQSGKQISII